MQAVAEPGSAVWFWAAAATIIATLASAVAMLYKAQIAMKDTEVEEGKLREESLKEQLTISKNDHRTVIEQLTSEVEECRKDREELRVQMAIFETRLSMLEQHERATTERVVQQKQRLDNLEDD